MLASNDCNAVTSPNKCARHVQNLLFVRIRTLRNTHPVRIIGSCYRDAGK